MGKYLRKKKRKVNIPIRAAAVLLCLTLFSTYLVSGLFARYTASAEGSDGARVAKFSIQGNDTLTQPIAVSLAPGDTKEVSLLIENESEVAVEYTIDVTKGTNNLPLSLHMVSEVGTPAVADTFTVQRLPGSHTDRYTLYIDWKAEENDPAVMGMVDYIAVTVTAAQID